MTERLPSESAEAFSLRVKEDCRARGVETLREKTREALLSLVKKNAPRRILEIGTAEGATALEMALAAKTARIVTVEKDEARFLAAKENFIAGGVSDRIRQILGDAREVVQMLKEPYDLILLDGPKGMYGEFYGTLTGLLSEGGVLFADDVSFHGYVTGEQAYRRKHGAIIRSLKEFLEKAESDPTVTSVFYQEEDGYLLITKKKTQK